MKFKYIGVGWVVCDRCGEIQPTNDPGPSFWPAKCSNCKSRNLWRFTDHGKAKQHSFDIWCRVNQPAKVSPDV